MAGLEIGLAGGDGLEHVAIGNQAQALLPRTVRRRVIFLYIFVAQLFLERFFKLFDDLLRVVARHLEGDILHLDILEPDDLIGPHFGHDLAQQIGQPVLCRTREIPGRCPLQHRDVTGFFRHHGDDCHRGRAAADDHHFLA